MVNVDMVLLRTFAMYFRCGSYCGPVPVECRLPLAALQLTSIRKVTTREMRGQLNNKSYFCNFNSDTSFMNSTKDDTSLQYHKFQFLLIKVHLHILHYLHALFLKGILKMPFETDSRSTKKMDKVM
jgi:hypothetical protein